MLYCSPAQVTYTLPKGSTRTAALRIGGGRFTGQEVVVTSAMVRQLRINPSLYRPGLKMFLLSESDFEQACRLRGIENGSLGFYSLNPISVAEVLTGRLDELPASDRVTILPLPQGPLNAEVVAHEVLHDIFVAGGLTKDLRDQFISRLAVWVLRATRNKARRPRAHQFYAEVRARSPYIPQTDLTLQEFVRLREGKSPYSSKYCFFSFECFSYGGTFYLRYPMERGFAAIPRELAEFLDQIKIAVPDP